jgi:hypothetical protein
LKVELKIPDSGKYGVERLRQNLWPDKAGVERFRENLWPGKAGVERLVRIKVNYL